MPSPSIHKMILYNNFDQPLTAISYDTALLANLRVFISQESQSVIHMTPEEFFITDKHRGIFLNLVQKDIKLREKISLKLDSLGLLRFSFVHHSSDVVDLESIGPGVFVWPNCTIDRAVNLEKDVIICSQSMIGHNSTVSFGSYISPGVMISGSTKVGKFCNIGIGSVLVDHIEVCDYVCTGAATVVRKSITESGVYVNENCLKKLREYF